MALPPGQGINNLTTLIKRLEAATSRLEDIASSASSFETPPSPLPTTNTGPEVATPASEPSSFSKDASETPKAVAPSATPLPPAIVALDELLDTEVKAFVNASKDIDPLVEEQAAFVAKAFADQRRFLVTTTQAKKPDLQSPETFNVLLQDLQQDMGAVGDIRDSHRSSAVKEHLAMAGEGIGALQWLIMDGKPADYVGEVIGGAQMYGNRVLKAYKEGDQSHVNYVRSYYALLKSLRDFILKHYMFGVTWNNNGIDAEQAYREAGSTTESFVPASYSTPTATAAASAPPPPPPPPPPPLPPALPDADGSEGSKIQPASGGGDMGAVFEQLNRGEAVTANLKKVDKSQMTHKNPSLRAGSTVGEARSKSPGPNVKPKPASMRQNSSPVVKKGTGKKELDGNKWLIENWDSPAQPIRVDVALTHSLLVTNCKDTTIIVKGKANAISIDNSPRIQILLDTLVSSVDVIRSPKIALQVTGTVPTIMLDQVDGASIYLSKESISTEIFTSKCSSINIVLPPESDEDDSKECPVPEQIRTVIIGGRVVSEIVEHAG